jgi:predicted ATPase/class 3 adenylate cyclase
VGDHDGVSRELPSGTVTFLFTDIEGSTRLLRELGPEQYADALQRHRLILRRAFSAYDGVEVDTQGDAFFVAFPTAEGAAAAARDAQSALCDGPIRVRVGIHSGTPHVTAEGYVGVDVHRAARIAAAGHGGQVLLSAAAAERLTSNELRDLGEHRLKDFDDAISIFQLGSEQFPPLKTISNTNLPRPASSFVGRERELDDVVSLLRDRARLLTLTGPGGSGKTRLAIEAAAELVPEFKSGVFWIGLASLRDSALVVETIANTLGAKDGLTEHIGERDLLLVLDNLEQVVEAAPQLAALVESCGNLRLLVTSRELLRVRGEVEYPVAPLAQAEAVELFCTRAHVEPDDAIAELCRRLDNLPLAVELAAARIAVLSPRQILDRLGQRLDLLKGGRDADPRQETLRATISWSHDLLDGAEKRLFARLAVFRGGCALESAHDVAGAELDVLQSLTEKSLVRHSGERFWMLETIREYARDRLDLSGDADDLRRRHADHYLAFAERAYPHVLSSPKTWLDRLEDEHDNLRSALDEFEARRETQLALQLAGALGPFWMIGGHHAEAARRLEALLAVDDRPTAARARALPTAAGLALDRGEFAEGRTLAEEALTLNRLTGDAWGVAYANHVLAYAAQCVGDWETARERFDESLRSFRALGDDHMVGIAIDLLGLACFKLGDRDRAVALEEENLRTARAKGNARVEAKALGAMGMYIVDAGRVDEAVPLLLESTRIFRELGSDLDEVAQNLFSLARGAAVVGETDAAVRMLSAASSALEELGITPGTYEADLNDDTVSIIRRDLDETAFSKAWADGQKLTVDDAVALALDSL